MPDAPSEALIRGIDRLVLRVPNLPAAVRYYREVLGLRVVREGGTFATLALGDGRELLLHNGDDLPAEATFLLVDDVRDLYAKRADLRLNFAGPPARVGRGYRATVKDPFGTVLLVIDRTLERASNAAAETGQVPHALFPGVTPKLSPRRAALATLYEKAGRTADDLPYTPQFESIHTAYAAGFPEPQPTRGETWRHLLLLRKKGDLPKLGAAKSTPPCADPATAALIRRLFAEVVGTDIGRRDRLPYSPQFDRLTERFNAARVAAGEPPLAPHQLWRTVAGIAK